MKEKLTKLQIERIEDRLRDKINELVAKRRADINGIITYAQILDAVRDGRLKLRKTALHPDMEVPVYCDDISVRFGDLFDVDKLNKELSDNRNEVEKYRTALKARNKTIMDKIILNGETLEWALKQLEK